MKPPKPSFFRSLWFSLATAFFTGALAAAEVVPLDGTWLVEEGVAPDTMPASFSHKVPVPGLAHEARPAFPDVDQYETHEFVFTMQSHGLPPGAVRGHRPHAAAAELLLV